MNLHDKMNAFLADQIVMFIKLHNLHWYVQGKGFFTLHSKYEELYDATADIIDDVAERLLALGAKPVASIKRATDMAMITELDDIPVSSEQSVKVLKADIESSVKCTRDIINLAEGENDSVTADQFSGYLQEYEKLLWMLNAYEQC